MLIASTFLLWVVVAVLGIAVLALVRQVGALSERLAADALPAPPVGDGSGSEVSAPDDRC